MHPRHLQPVIEIGADLPRTHIGSQIARGPRHDAHPRAAVHQIEEQELRLARQGADLVQIKAAALRRLEGRRQIGARQPRRAAFDEGRFGLSGHQMDHLGDLGCPRSRRPEDQDLGLCLRHLAHRIAQRLRGLRGAEQHPRRRIAGLQLCLQTAVFQNQSAGLERPLHLGQQIRRAARFFQKAESPLPHGPHRHRNITLAGQKDHRQFRIHALRKRKQMEPVAPRHADIGQDHPVKGGGDMVLGLDEAARDLRHKIAQYERLAQGLAHRRVVIHT